MYEYRNTTTIRLPDRTIVTDPCYDSKLKCLAHINTLPGEYTCNCIYDLTDRNIKGLRIKHTSLGSKEFTCEDLKLSDQSVSVDSGTAGFFDEYIFKQIEADGYDKKEKWYKDICRQTSEIIDNEPVRLENNTDIMMIITKLASYFNDNKISPKNHADISAYFTAKHNDAALITTQISDILKNKFNITYDENARSIDPNILRAHLAQICKHCKSITNKDFYAFQSTRKICKAINIDNMGFASNTAYGDGTYAMYVHKNQQKQITYAKLIFDFSDKMYIREFRKELAKEILNDTRENVKEFLGPDIFNDTNTKHKYNHIKRMLKYRNTKEIMKLIRENTYLAYEN